MTAARRQAAADAAVGQVAVAPSDEAAPTAGRAAAAPIGAAGAHDLEV